jgi:DNA end-binding protein Ku
MLDTGKAGVATMVMRDREHLVVLRPSGDALIVESLYFNDEIREAGEVLGDLPDDSAFAERELKIAEQLIESLAVDWKPDSYHDTYRARVQELIESKREGRKVVTAKKAPRTNVIDLMAALEESIAARGGRGAKADKPAKAKKAGKKTAADDASATTGAAEYADMSKAELLKLAAEADVAGRSSMSKEELAAALSAAPKSRRSRAS